MEIEKVIKILFNKYDSFYCLDIFKKLYMTNNDFKTLIIDGIENNKIHGIPINLIYKFNKYFIDEEKNETIYNSLKMGRNINASALFSEIFSCFYSTKYFCRGFNNFYREYLQSNDNLFTWIELNDSIIDPILMLEVDNDYVFKMGYVIKYKSSIHDNLLHDYYIK